MIYVFATCIYAIAICYIYMIYVFAICIYAIAIVVCYIHVYAVMKLT